MALKQQYSPSFKIETIGLTEPFFSLFVYLLSAVFAVLSDLWLRSKKANG